MGLESSAVWRAERRDGGGTIRASFFPFQSVLAQWEIPEWV